MRKLFEIKLWKRNYYNKNYKSECIERKIISDIIKKKKNLIKNKKGKKVLIVNK